MTLPSALIQLTFKLENTTTNNYKLHICSIYYFQVHIESSRYTTYWAVLQVSLNFKG